MFSVANTPLEQTLVNGWARVDATYKRAFFVVLFVNLLAFGFEMTNLTIDHDDVWQIFIQDDIIGSYIGRFALGWLQLYTQGSHIMPFLQVLEGITIMTIYGLLVARLWELEKTVDIVLIASVLCVFPYMAQVNSYNAEIYPYSVAHLLSAAAVSLSIRATAPRLAAAAMLYVGAFLIYQSVIANSATIFAMWLLSGVLFGRHSVTFSFRRIATSTAAALLAVVAGGLLYLTIIWYSGSQFDAYQGANKAFSLAGEDRWGLRGLSEVLLGTRAFFFWPEPYFPDYLKKLQLVFLLGAGIVCVWRPDRLSRKVTALVVLGLSLITPRLLQFLHPGGDFHSLTLTAYAVSVAGFVMILVRGGNVLTRNLSAILAALLLVGYLIQANWISTVNYLNTLAHYATMTQMLSRLGAISGDRWDGKRVVFIGNLLMQSTYPFKHATGVATTYIDEKLAVNLVNLLRADIVVLPPETVPGAAEYAASHRPWPHPSSVGVVDGVGVVVLSNDHRPGEAPRISGSEPQVAPN